MITDHVDSWLTIDQAAEQLGLSASKVRRLIEELVLFAVKVDGRPAIPADIIVDGQPLSSIRGTLIQLHDLGLSSAEAVDWLYEENEILGRTPISALLEGHKAPVRRAAQALG